MTQLEEKVALRRAVVVAWAVRRVHENMGGGWEKSIAKRIPTTRRGASSGRSRAFSDDVKTSIAARLKSTFKSWYVSGND
jgi:hypothetical protein